MDFKLFLFSILAYIIGSFPTAIIYAKRFHGIDIKQHGSGNSGATNSMRVLGKKAGLTVLIVDILKGYVPTFLALHYFHEPWKALFIGLFVVIGHIFSVFANFKGGKGIATSFGVILAINPLGALISVIVFLITIQTTKYVSLASLMGNLTFYLYIIFFQNYSIPFQILCTILLLLLTYTHQQNIRRLIRGEENRLNANK